VRLIEEGAHTRLRLEESCELLKRKVDSTNKVERPAEMKLRKEREEYRVRFFFFFLALFKEYTTNLLHEFSLC
jgi:hypothetical protein